MFLRNTSRYPDDEVKALIKWVETQGFDLSKVCVNVKNNFKGAIAGMAYGCIPSQSNAPRTAKYLVTLRIGQAKDFSYTNVWIHYKWVKITHDEYLEIQETNADVATRGCGKTVNGVTTNWMEKAVGVEHAYGGLGSPVYTVNDWKEGLVALAAHEFNHIRQFQNKTPCSEIRCEKKALEVLEAYRQLQFTQA